jgi:hypothetical protein
MGDADGDHLALMARSGLMTHVAELAPPVTAASMARFRAEAAAQASNVMALASGRFALCLPSGRREIRTTVAHRLFPLPAHPADNGGLRAPASEGRPRRIPPPSERRGKADAVGRADPAGAVPAAPALAKRAGDDAERAPPGQRPQGAEDVAAREAEDPATAADATGAMAQRGEGGAGGIGAAQPTLAALARGQTALADGLTRLAGFIDSAETRAEAASTARERTLDELAARMEAAAARVEAGAEHRARAAAGGHLGNAVGRALTEAEGRLAGAVASTEARLADGIEAAHGAQADAIVDLRRALDGMSATQAEAAARQDEALAALRLGLRALNDRLAGLEAEGPLPAVRGAGAAMESGARAPSSMRDVDDVTGSGDLHGALQALLGQLSALEPDMAGRPGAAGAHARPRPPRALRDGTG